MAFFSEGQTTKLNNGKTVTIVKMENGKIIVRHEDGSEEKLTIGVATKEEQRALEP